MELRSLTLNTTLEDIYAQVTAQAFSAFVTNSVNPNIYSRLVTNLAFKCFVLNYNNTIYTNYIRWIIGGIMRKTICFMKINNTVFLTT